MRQLKLEYRQAMSSTLLSFQSIPLKNPLQENELKQNHEMIICISYKGVCVSYQIPEAFLVSSLHMRNVMIQLGQCWIL